MWQRRCPVVTVDVYFNTNMQVGLALKASPTRRLTSDVMIANNTAEDRIGRPRACSWKISSAGRLSRDRIAEDSRGLIESSIQPGGSHAEQLKSGRRQAEQC